MTDKGARYLLVTTADNEERQSRRRFSRSWSKPFCLSGRQS
jgi:hypothetical protein